MKKRHIYKTKTPNVLSSNKNVGSLCFCWKTPNKKEVEKEPKNIMPVTKVLA